MLENALSAVEEFVENVRVADAVDMLLMSVIVYSALVWFKEAASRRVVIGLSFLGLVYFLARAFNLYLTSLVFHTGFTVLLIMLVVVFQEDLRRMFETIAGWGSLRRLRQNSDDTTDVDTLVEAAFAMAAAKIGALIVVPGREPLERHLHGGIPLFGQISKPLLFSIFDPNSAGHDGAIVIHRDRVERFAVHLPISKNRTEIGGRGTRHSAALGLSELSDALVIAVSEERGVVSVAENGRLKQNSSAASLKGRIEVFLASRFPGDAPAPFKRFILRHWKLKVLAVLLAGLAWFTLAFKPNTVQRTFVVPIEYQNLPEQLQLDENAESEARLTLSGSEQNFRFLEPSSLKVSIDLSQAEPGGSQEFFISSQNVTIPQNLEFYRIWPQRVRLDLEPNSQAPKNGEPQSKTRSPIHTD